jgi:hypothetical protein
MPDQLSLMVGKVDYIAHTVDEDLAPNCKPGDVDHVIDIHVDLKHIKNDGHEIEFRVEQGLMKKNSSVKILMIESTSKFKVIPYDSDFFKKPAKIGLVNLITDIAVKALDHNLGMFVIIREDYGMKDILPMPFHKGKIKDMIFNDINRQLLS